MTPFLLILVLISASLQTERSIIGDHVFIAIHTYETSGEIKASAMSALKPDSELAPFKRRFEYLLMNVPEIHRPDRSEERKEIWGLYPDTVELKRRYLEKFIHDEKLVRYFEEANAAIQNPKTAVKNNYSMDEIMGVASRFFYCDKVLPDTSVQAHVCIGLNGIREADWNKDYVLLEAFCYEAIFSDLDKDESQLWATFGVQKAQAVEAHKTEIVSLDGFLNSVKIDVFRKMEKNALLQKTLTEYYTANQSNLSFTITN